jgi:hypothetical protein
MGQLQCGAGDCSNAHVAPFRHPCRQASCRISVALVWNDPEGSNELGFTWFASPEERKTSLGCIRGRGGVRRTVFRCCSLEGFEYSGVFVWLMLARYLKESCAIWQTAGPVVAWVPQEPEFTPNWTSSSVSSKRHKLERPYYARITDSKQSEHLTRFNHIRSTTVQRIRLAGEITTVF